MSNAELRTRLNNIPNWAYETLRVMADVHQMTASIETELRYAAHLQGMDRRLADKLQAMRDAVGVLQVSFSALEVSAQQVLSEIAHDTQRNSRSESGR
jgi:hypothetical protein